MSVCVSVCRCVCECECVSVCRCAGVQVCASAVGGCANVTNTDQSSLNCDHGHTGAMPLPHHNTNNLTLYHIIQYVVHTLYMYVVSKAACIYYPRTVCSYVGMYVAT